MCVGRNGKLNGQLYLFVYIIIQISVHKKICCIRNVGFKATLCAALYRELTKKAKKFFYSGKGFPFHNFYNYFNVFNLSIPLQKSFSYIVYLCFYSFAILIYNLIPEKSV